MLAPPPSGSNRRRECAAKRGRPWTVESSSSSPSNVLALAVALAVTQAVTEAYDLISPQLIQAHVEYLASDALEGRGTGERGGEIAARYIAAQFRRLRLQAGGDEGTYLQELPLQVSKGDDGSELRYQGARSAVSFGLGSEWIARGACPTPETLEGPLVYVGHGIWAPGEKQDDFAAVDLTGKVALALWGAPPQLARQPEIAWLAHPAWKAAAARARGARGLLLAVPAGDPALDLWARAPWAALPEGMPQRWAAPDAIVSDSVVRAILQASATDPDSLFAAADGVAHPAELGGTLTLIKRPRFEPVQTYNVVAVLPGTDPAKQNEAVVFAAHYDALGIGPARDGDSIHNGAADNAAGVAKLLALAEALALFPGRRAAVFLAAGAGALGHLGTWHYLARPGWSREATVAAISLDGGLELFGVPLEVRAHGTEGSTLQQAAERASRIMALPLVRDEHPDDAWTLGAGHIPFLLSGVPSAGVSAGLKFQGREERWGEALQARFLAERARRPWDEAGGELDYLGAAALSQWAYVLSRIVLDGEPRPEWDREPPVGPVRPTPACQSPGP